MIRVDIPSTGDGVPSNPFSDFAAPRSVDIARAVPWLRKPYPMTLRPNTGSHVAADANPGVRHR